MGKGKHGSHAGSDESGAGRAGSDRGTSQHAESGRREDAEENVGKKARGRLDAERETARDAHESTGRSRK